MAETCPELLTDWWSYTTATYPAVQTPLRLHPNVSRHEDPSCAEPWSFEEERAVLSSRSSPCGTQRNMGGMVTPEAGADKRCARGDQVLREHRQHLPHWLTVGAWLRLAMEDSPEGTLPRALRVPLRCHRGQPCARGDLRPGSQGLHRNRSRPGSEMDQEYHLHPSCFHNSAHQHLGGAHHRPPSVITARGKRA